MEGRGGEGSGGEGRGCILSGMVICMHMIFGTRKGRGGRGCFFVCFFFFFTAAQALMKNKIIKL